MRSMFLPVLLKDTFGDHPEMRQKVRDHFGISDWKLSQWTAGTKKPEPLLRMKVIEYIQTLLARKARGD